MFDNEILSPGKKIKKIRILFGIVQKEIIGNKSTNLLGQIENGKTALTYSTALIITENINNIFNKLNIDLITIDWLMEDIQLQINRKTSNYITNLENNISCDNGFTFYINKVEKFMHTYNVLAEQKIQIFNLAIDFYAKSCNFNKKKIYLLRLKDIYASLNKHKLELECMFKIMIVYYRLNEFEYVIDLGNYILNNMTLYSIEDNSLTKKIYFNIALSYKKIGGIKCLEYLEKLENEINLSFKEEFDIKLLKANYYKEVKNYKKAEYICQYILNKEVDNNIKAATYSTLAEIYLDYGNIIIAENYIDKAIKCDIKNDDYVVDFLYNALKINIAKYHSSNVEIYFNSSMGKAIITNNTYMQFKICNDTYKYFCNINDFSSILKVLDLIMTLDNKDKDIISIYLNAVSYFKDRDIKIRNKIIDNLGNL